MVQFLSIIFFLGFLQFLLGFSKVPVFCVTLYYHICKNNYMFCLYICSHHQAGYKTLNKRTIKYNTIKTFIFKVQGSVHRKYIPLYNQQNATLHSLFISGNCCTYFGWYLHPSPGAHTTVSYSIWYWSECIANFRYRGRVGTAVSALPR
jgi:hypothetical protein